MNLVNKFKKDNNYYHEYSYTKGHNITNKTYKDKLKYVDNE